MRINEDFVPSTIRQAVYHIVESLSIEEKANIQDNSNDSYPSYVAHHTVGRYIRNNWSLWEDDSPLKRDAVKTYGIAHADDISGLMIEWVFTIVRDQDDFDPVGHCELYHDHWKRAGTNSLSAGGWKAKE